jgi:hypothetical protein
VDSRGFRRFLRDAHRKGVALGKPGLMPIRVCERHHARVVEPADLIARERPADGAEIVRELRFVARTDDDVRDRGPREQPVERDLRDRLAGFGRDVIERIDDAIEILLGDGGPISAVVCSRLPGGSGAPRRILPVSRPQPSGLQTTHETPASIPSGINSHS